MQCNQKIIQIGNSAGADELNHIAVDYLQYADEVQPLIIQLDALGISSEEIGEAIYQCKTFDPNGEGGMHVAVFGCALTYIRSVGDPQIQQSYQAEAEAEKTLLKLSNAEKKDRNKIYDDLFAYNKKTTLRMQTSHSKSRTLGLNV